MCVAAVLCAWAACAVDFASLKPEGYVSDFARVLDTASRTQLERYCALVEKKTGAQMALVTLESVAGEPIEDVVNAMYRRWGIGKRETNEGVMLLLATRDRRMRLEVGYGLEPAIPDGFAGSVLRSMRPALRQGRYDEALMEAAHVLGSRIAEVKGVTLESGPPRRSRSRPRADIPWPLMLGGLFLLFWLISAGSRRGRRSSGFLPGLIVGNILGRAMSSGGRGGGGFGGWDSGDRFGGFGGGDSGGGGASSNW